MIGCAFEDENFETNCYLGSNKNGYGYFKEGGHVFNSSNENLIGYHQGDQIGVLIDYEEGIISFTKDDLFFHCVIQGLKEPMRAAFSCLYFNDQISIVLDPIPQFKEDYDENLMKYLDSSQKDSRIVYIRKINKYFKEFEWLNK